MIYIIIVLFFGIIYVIDWLTDNDDEFNGEVNKNE